MVDNMSLFNINLLSTNTILTFNPFNYAFSIIKLFDISSTTYYNSTIPRMYINIIN
jgi:hypothetical protein